LVFAITNPRMTPTMNSHKRKGRRKNAVFGENDDNVMNVNKLRRNSE
jgi:hypothetical protein